MTFNEIRFGGSDTNQKQLLDHPVGLFILFFTEMWERFSYYGMRALLVLFLTTSIMGDDLKGFSPGWGWDREAALALYGTYTALVYLTPILGGYIADKIIGYRSAVVIGALVMTLGHAAMAIDAPIFLYIGIGCLIIGNGFFKPNITSIISGMYKNHQEKKDGAFTIFYMGVNAGAFFGIGLCGYIGEKIGWHLGFGLAGIFMLFGLIQFWLAGPLFGKLGGKPEDLDQEDIDENKKDMLGFSPITLGLIAFMTIGGLFWIFNDTYSKITKNNILALGGEDYSNYFILFFVLLLFALAISRIIQYRPVVRDRLIAFFILAFFTVFFWWAFEQAGGSMTIFASDYTDRVLEGNSALIFKIFNTVLYLVPLGIITWVLIRLFSATFEKIGISNIALGASFVVIWAIVIWMLRREFLSDQTEIPASWFSILNSFFIITLAPLFSKVWESKYNPSGSVKFGLGLVLLGLGFGFLAYGSSGIPAGAATASVSIMWLVFAYLFHTMGELALSPVGLSYVTKLVPAGMIAFMFGIWYLAIAIGNKLAGSTGGMIDEITKQYDMSTFFLIFTAIPLIAGVFLIIINPLMKKLMHGVH